MTSTDVWQWAQGLNGSEASWTHLMGSKYIVHHWFDGGPIESIEAIEVTVWTSFGRILPLRLTRHDHLF
jgi:hypothetical protein